MYIILKHYFDLLSKHNLNKSRIYLYFLFIPASLSLILIFFKKNNISSIIIEGGSDLVNFLVLLSGFLFMSIGIVLSNININQKLISKMSVKLEKKEEYIKEMLFDLKQLLVYEIIVQFFLITFSVLLIVIYKGFQSKILLFFILFFVILSIVGIYRLARNFLLFQKNTIL